jgi:hypothetical protein
MSSHFSEWSVDLAAFKKKENFEADSPKIPDERQTPNQTPRGNEKNAM